MNVIAEFTVIPIGTQVSLSGYVAACQRVLAESGLNYELHANGTNLEGDWDAVMGAIHRCHEVLHGMGVPRLSTIIKIGTRVDVNQTMQDKVESVQEILDELENPPLSAG
jgi:uncharacterized protein (TIGR00106 family)